jgi:hypothetical protein
LKILGAIAGLIFLALVGLPAIFRWTDRSTQFALDAVKACPNIISYLGSPVEWSTVDLVWGSSMSVGAIETSNWQMDVSGSLRRATVKYRYSRNVDDVQFAGILESDKRQFHLPSCVDITNIDQRNPSEVVSIQIKADVKSSTQPGVNPGSTCVGTIFRNFGGGESGLTLDCGVKHEIRVYSGNGIFSMTPLTANEKQFRVEYHDLKDVPADTTPTVVFEGESGKPHGVGGTLTVESRVEQSPLKIVLNW